MILSARMGISRADSRVAPGPSRLPICREPAGRIGQSTPIHGFGIRKAAEPAVGDFCDAIHGLLSGLTDHSLRLPSLLHLLPLASLNDERGAVFPVAEV